MLHIMLYSVVILSTLSSILALSIEIRLSSILIFMLNRRYASMREQCLTMRQYSNSIITNVSFDGFTIIIYCCIIVIIILLFTYFYYY